MLCVYSEKIASQCCIKLLILNELAENSFACRQDIYIYNLPCTMYYLALVADRRNISQQATIPTARSELCSRDPKVASYFLQIENLQFYVTIEVTIFRMGEESIGAIFTHPFSHSPYRRHGSEANGSALLRNGQKRCFQKCLFGF